MMLKPTRVRIRGFRGFVADQELEFATAAILLLGENHQGKSSVLNAIEWCLYGDECHGGNSGIRERVNWEIPSRHLQPPDVRVELEFKDGSTTYVLTRSMRPHPKRAKLQEELTVVMPTGQELSGDDAERVVRQLVRASFRDFMTTIYQHQEILRVLITEEPRKRNDAIDRLLGLSAHRNLIAAIDAAALRAKQKQVAQHYDGFLREVLAALNARRNDLREKRQEAANTGLTSNDLTPQGSLSRAAALLTSLQKFADGIGTQSPNRPTPVDWRTLPAYAKWLKTELKRLSGEIPESKRQADFLSRRQRLLEVQSEYAAKKTSYDSAKNDVRKFNGKHGGAQTLNASLEQVVSEIQQATLMVRKASARRNLVREAIAVIEATGGKGGTTKCPLCGNLTKDLLAHLRDEFERAVAEEVKEAEDNRKTLEAKKDQLLETRAEHNRLAKAIAPAEARLGKVRAEVAAALGKPVEVSVDPLALVNHELERVDKELERLNAAAASRQQILADAEEELGQLELAAEILVLEDKQRVIEHIQEAPEFKKLEALRDELARWIADVDDIKKAISRDSNEHAQRKVAAAEQQISQMFHRLTDHPALDRLSLAVTADAASLKNSYTFAGSDGRDIVPILSQGDMNALALSIFLGLSSAGDGSNRFGFIMLDDPSQSLGTSHKRQLVGILNEVLGEKTVIISTMDKELEDMLRRLIIPAKSLFRLSGWLPGRGPNIELG